MSLPCAVLWVARYDYRPRWKLNPHSHDFYQIIFVKSGGGLFRIEKDERVIKPPCLYVLPPECLHSLEAGPSGDLRTLDIKFTVADRSLKKSLRTLPRRIENPSQRIPALIEAIRRSGEVMHRHRRLLCDSLLTQLMVHLLEEASDARDCPPSKEGEGIPEASDPWARQVASHMRRNHEHKLTLAGLAAFFSLSPRRFRDRFRSAVGESPLEYLHSYRLERAREKLAYSDFGIKQVAALCGFVSVPHFTRSFTSATGLSPGEWRRRHGEGIGRGIIVDPTFRNTDRTSRS